MKDDDALPISTPTAPSSSFSISKKETSDSAIFGRGRYKFWAFTVILLLAFWSMFTGTVTLRWSAGNLNAIYDDIDIPLPEDLDVLEMEEREKLVKHMWDVYTNSRGIKLIKFWQEAFEASYEELISDVPGVPEEAISEIAKMSVRYIPVESPPLHSSGVRELSLRQMKREQTTATGRMDDEKLVKEIGEASKEWGIFQVMNHGIPDEVIANLQKVGKEFFEEVPQEEKELIAKKPGAQSIEGYGTSLQKEVEGKKGWVDHLFHKIWPPSAINYRYWPKNPPSYREANEEYAKRLREVVDRIFRSLSLGLGLEAHEMIEAAGSEDIVYMLKINYYPPCPRPDLALGVVPHTDMSYITLLVPNEVQGLQVFKDGHWYDVNYIPNAIIVHIGDQVEILSNGKYKSVYHRTTVNKDKTRMSWPVFLEPPSEHEVGPLPKLINEANPPKFKTKKYKDYVYCKLNKLPQ